MIDLDKRIESLAVEILYHWELAGKPTFKISTDDVPKVYETMDKNLLTAHDKAQLFIDELLKEYSELYVIKKIQPRVRKVLKERSNTDEYRQLPVCLFTVQKSLLEKHSDDYKIRVQQQCNKVDGRTKIKYANVLKSHSILKEWLEIPYENLTLKDCAKKLIALGFFSGRRLYQEILIQGEFTIDKSKSNHVIFKGQAKGSEEKANTAYSIPILGLTPKDFIYHLDMLKASLNRFKWFNNEAVESKTIQANFSKYTFSPMLEIAKILELKSFLEPGKDSRKIYISTVDFNLRNQGDTRDFTEKASDFLGHGYIDKKTGIKISDVNTSRSYNSYEIIF